MFHFSNLILFFFCLFLNLTVQAQTVQDDFEGSGTITNWLGDDCQINTNFSNPYQEGINTSATVLEYHDVGGQYANVRFQIATTFDLVAKNIFSLKIYVPSSGITGSQPNQVSLKLQNGNLGEPWSTQCEIIKSVTLDEWQTLTFDFANDSYINLDPNSPPPTQRSDFNRVVIQVNSENNNDQVLAYIDDIDYYAPIQEQIVFDDFEGNGTITNWTGDDCQMNNSFSNPFQEGINTSATVLRYNDVGGSYANVRFQMENTFDLMTNNTFSLKVYVPSNGITGGQPNQVSLKLQDGNLAEPWNTQSEIIKPITLDEWQTVTFDFENDNFINLNPGSPPPTQRTDFNRVVIQINGENNNDQVLAYIDDIDHYDTVSEEPIFNQLVWSDEFDEDGAINNLNWFQQFQLPAGGSWYNNEIQHYTNRIDNSFVENGVLKIVAKKETFTDQGHTKEYTSARLNSKFAFTYGRVEVRAKLPTGVGTWPAIWMLGQNINEDGAYWDNEGFGTTPWPACGEMDIMEHWGHNQNYVQSATHTPSSFGGTINHGGQTISTASTAFHVYALEWTAEKLVFSVDDVVHFTYNPTDKDADTWPFDAPQYILLNIAILPSIEAGFTESAMEIDYVRVYQEGSPLSINEEESSEESMEEVNKEKVRFYPNPVEDTMYVALEDVEEEEVVFYIYGIDGRLVQTQVANTNNGEFVLKNLGSLARGLYFTKCEVNRLVYSFKFLKNPK